MYEKVSPFHPDKVADRISGALVDLAYTRSEGGWAKSNPRIAVELTIGHGEGLCIVETDADITVRDVTDTVQRISGITHCTVRIVPQDPHLARNQHEGLRCGDNGIFRGMPVTAEQRELSALMRTLAHAFPTDAKAVLTTKEGAPSEGRLIVCQSQAAWSDIHDAIQQFAWDNGPARRQHCHIYDFDPAQIIINPLGSWTGGTDTDTGAVNRKLGSDMGDAVSGGGLHGKDLSKADVSVNIVCHLLAQQHKVEVHASCAIGDETVTFQALPFHAKFPITMSYQDIVEQARLYILTQHGSFEHFAEWGLI